MPKVSIQEDTSHAWDEPSERRRSDRTELTVRVDYSTVDELFSEFTRDVNEGGLFLETDEIRPAGTLVSMQFNLPGGAEAIQTQGRVVHTTQGDSGSPRGMGIEFEELGERERAQIDELIRSLRAESQSLDD